MVEVLAARDADDVAEIVAWAAAGAVPLELRAGASKAHWGRPAAAAHRLDLAAIKGVVTYEPEELVLTARPGTAIGDIEKLLAQRGQELAFEPGDWRPWLGTEGDAEGGTLGGVIACNLSGPRRVRAGAARDHFLGCKGVSGRGEAFKAGGRVVKNVTGYDVCKLLAGSHGTLAALTEITVKVLPKGEKTRTVLLFGLDDQAAVAALAQAAGSPHDVSALAHLPAAVARRSGVAYVAGAGAAVTAVRVEGTAVSVAYRCRALTDMFARFKVEELHSANSQVFWREMRDVAFFAAGNDRVLWRLGVPPASAPAVVAAIASAMPAEYFFDWGGGLIWLSLPPDASAVHTVRSAVGEGHATLMRAPPAMRSAVPVFQPEPLALAALSRRVKSSFDPKNILNPGRMFEGA
jgi:glycolate oxidase FAD binding subunit